MRLIIAVVVGLVIAVGAVAVVENVLSHAADGTPSNASLYQYGTRLRPAGDQAEQLPGVT